MKHTRPSLAGYSLPAILGVTAVLAVSISILVVTLQTSVSSTQTASSRRKSFYVCDGLGRTVTRLAHNYMSATSTPNASDMFDHVCAQGGGCGSVPMLPTVTPAGYSVEEFSISPVGASVANAPLPTGPFRGMNARVDTVEFSIKARSTAGFECASKQTVSLGKISIFQFYVFSDTFFDSHPGPQMTLNGRLHVNGTACLGGNTNVDRVTASDEVLALDGAGCQSYGGWRGTVGVNDGTGTYVELTDANDHNSNGSWESFATSTWNGNVQDSAHDVPVLRPPTLNPPTAQAGVNADGSTHSNIGSLRFLVDPVVGGEPADVSAQKYAYKADLRILDGVWYLADPAQRDAVGTPIWSDHPGSFTRAHPEGLSAPQVGQQTVATAQGWATVPRRFSYYRYTAANGLHPRTLSTDPRGTISYGSLGARNARGATTTRWEPAAWMDGDGGKYTAPCGTADASTPTQDRFDDQAAFNTNGFRTISSGVGVPMAAGMSPCQDLTVLNATRGGFVETHRQGGPAGTVSILAATPDRGQMLPLNFDVEAFTAAMQDTGVGELGSYFSSSNFNGIVWIGSTWPGSLDGITSGGLADLTAFDAQGAATVGATPTSLAAGGQTIGPTWVRTAWPRTGGYAGAPSGDHGVASNVELPSALCSADATAIGDTLALYGLLPGESFVVPPCAGYTRERGAYVTAVRVFNAANIDRTVFPEGLSIVSNLPMYALGDLNVSSTPGGTPWVPFMIGGDSLHHLSNNWQDASGAWHLFNDDGYVGHLASRRATPTTYNAAAMAGWVPSFNGSGGTRFHNFNGYNERWTTAGWSSIAQNINASNVIGWASVYMRNNRSSGYPQYMPPQRAWAFDTNFRIYANQPPGAPVFDVAAVKSFERN